MSEVPDGVTEADIIDEFGSLFAGTPPAESSLAASMMPTKYAALQSGGQTIYNEFDLTSSTYAVVCSIIDAGTSCLHLQDGMVTTLTVEQGWRREPTGC